MTGKPEGPVRVNMLPRGGGSLKKQEVPERVRGLLIPKPERRDVFRAYLAFPENGTARSKLVNDLTVEW